MCENFFFFFLIHNQLVPVLKKKKIENQTNCKLSIYKKKCKFIFIVLLSFITFKSHKEMARCVFIVE